MSYALLYLHFYAGLGSAAQSAPSIELSGNSIPEDAAVNDFVGTLSISNPVGNWVNPIAYTLTDSAGGKFKIETGDDLQVAGALNWETATSHSITVEADNGTDAPISVSFTINVTNVLEITLSALTLDNDTIVESDAVGTVVGAIVGKTSGSTLTLLADGGGKYALDGLNIEVADALFDGTDEITVRETHPDGNNSPLDTVLSITVEAVEEPPPEGAVFYVKTGGSDLANGLTEATAWATTSRVNEATITPGQSVLFNRGDTFTGGLVLLGQSGDEANQITFGAYGSGADPIIESAADEGFFSENVHFFTVQDLEFRGDAVTPNAVNGVHVENSEEDDTQKLGIQLLRLTVSEYGKNGIAVIGTLGSSGFTAPVVQDCTVFNCTHNIADGYGSAGIYVRSLASFGLGENAPTFNSALIEDCLVYDCPGTAGDLNWNGSGIFLAESSAGIIAGCVAHDCGASGNFGSGPIGIWTGDSSSTLIIGCESHHNQNSVRDGGGFGLDGGCGGCVITQSYSHDNDGSGFQIYEYGYPSLLAMDNNEVSFCITENDCQDTSDAFTGGIVVAADANVTDVKIYNNTIYSNLDSTHNLLSLWSNTGVSTSDYDGYIANNIFVSTNGARLINQPLGSNPAAMRLRGNNYYATGAFVIRWGGVNYTSIADWQLVATTQEKVSAVNVSMTIDPMFLDAGNGGTINADNALLTAYKVASSSPMLGAGLDLSTFGITVRSEDFHGNPYPRSPGVHDLGATVSTYADVIAPTITSASTANNVEDTVLAHALTADEVVTWSITGGADAADFEISGSTLRWPSNGTRDFEAPADADLNNIYVVQVTATDGASNATNQTISVTVQNDVDVIAPTITSANTASVEEFAVLAHALTANETVTWSITGGVDAADFEISGSTLRWTDNGTQDFDDPQDTGANNGYVVQVTATDLAANATNQSITVTVTAISFETETDAIVAAMITAGNEPTKARKVLINAAVSDMIAAAIWSEADALWFTAAHFEGGALINWKSPGTFNLIKVNTVAFDDNLGFTSDTISGRMRTQFTPSTDGVGYQQDSSSMWLWSNTTGTSNAYDMGTVDSPQARLRLSTGSSLFSAIFNDATVASAGAPVSGAGLYGVQRRAAADKRVWHNGVQLAAPVATASTGEPNTELWLCGANSTTFSIRQQAFAFVGGPLTGKEAALYSIVSTYMAAAVLAPPDEGGGTAGEAVGLLIALTKAA